MNPFTQQQHQRRQGDNLPSDQLGANKILAPQAKQSVKSHQLLSLGAFCQGERQVSFFTFLLYLPCSLLLEQYSKVFVRVFGNIDRDKIMV